MTKGRATAKRISLDKREWNSLTPRQKSIRVKALGAISLMRKEGRTLTNAAKVVHTSPTTVMRHVGSVIIKSKGTYVAKASDKIQSSMLVKTNGQEIPVTVTGSKMRSIIGTYQSAVERYIATGDDSDLSKFEGVTIKDSEGVKHELETDLDKIQQIEESREDRESYQLYSEE